MINYLEIISTIVFFGLIGIFLIKDRKKTERHAVIFMRRWTRGLEFIDSMIRKREKFFSVVGWIAIFTGVVAGIVGIVTMVLYTIRLQRMIGFVLPTVSGYQIPGPVVSVPFWYWLIGIFVLMFVHETSHAIFARLEKVRLKNYGIMLLFVLPVGAFVDPDMKKVEKLKTSKKLKIFAAGSFGNFLTALVIFILGMAFSFAVSNLFVESKGVYFNGTMEGYPAYESNLTGIIQSVNGMDVRTAEEFLKVLNSTRVGDSIEIGTNVSTYRMNTVARPDDPSRSFIGILQPRDFLEWKIWIRSYIPFLNMTNMLLFWLFLLNLSVGVANMLPWKPFDGGLILEEVATKLFKKKGRTIANIITALMVCLALFNMFGVEILKRII